MNLTIHVLGLELLSLSVTTDEDDEDDQDRAHVDGTFVGFTARPEQPEEYPVRTLPWQPED